MSRFNVGDHITPNNSLKGVNVYEVTTEEGVLRVIRYGQDNLSANRVGSYVHRAVGSLYILHKAANPNLITVQASTFKDEDGLTQEDKQIIKEHLDDKAA